MPFVWRGDWKAPFLRSPQTRPLVMLEEGASITVVYNRRHSTMSGYSGTPLPRKLGLSPGCRFGVVRPPEAFAAALGALPDGVSMEPIGAGRRRSSSAAASADHSAGAPFDVIVCFVRSLREVDEQLSALRARLAPAGGFWMAWPKKTSGMVTDANENEIRARGLAAGLVDNKVCAIDETWSGLRFVIRLVDRKPTGSGATSSARKLSARPAKAR